MKSFTKVRALTYFLDNFEMSSKLKCMKHQSRKEVIFLTAQGLEYLQSLNLKEHNLEMEAQARRELRQQKRRDAEVKRHDKKQERIDFKKVKVESRKAKEEKRHHIKTEKESKRHNIRTEKTAVRELGAKKWYNTQQVRLSRKNLDELIRHNRAGEQIEGTKAGAAMLNAQTGAKKYRSDVALKRTDQRIAKGGQRITKRGQNLQLHGTKYSADSAYKGTKFKAKMGAAATKYKTDTEFKSAKAKLTVEDAKNQIQAAYNAGRLGIDAYKEAMKSVNDFNGNITGLLGKALPMLAAG